MSLRCRTQFQCKNGFKICGTTAVGLTLDVGQSTLQTVVLLGDWKIVRMVCINSDPLTQFAVVFAALIHDVDHTGVRNGQLAKEDPHHDLADTRRSKKSLAEQTKHVDMAGGLLMDSSYEDLRTSIYANESELPLTFSAASCQLRHGYRYLR
jgi:hypothetical protein